MFTTIIKKRISDLEKTLVKLETTFSKSKKKPIKDGDKEETKTK